MGWVDSAIHPLKVGASRVSIALLRKSLTKIELQNFVNPDFGVEYRTRTHAYSTTVMIKSRQQYQR